jgi:integrase
VSHYSKQAPGSLERGNYRDPLGGKSLVRLHAADLKPWRDGLNLGKAASHRILTALKAALNLAVRNRHAPASLAVELRAVTPYKNAGKRRNLYLDLRQRRAPLKAATGAVRDLIDAVIVTGCRAGELTSMTCAAFGARTKVAQFVGKTGSRTVPLSPTAVALLSLHVAPFLDYVGATGRPRHASHNGTTGSRFARRGLRFGSGKNRGAEPHTNGSRP